MTDTYQHIAVGVIKDSSGDRVLVSKRPDKVHQGGLWEFPGGKMEQHESVTEALSREVREELGIDVTCSQPLIQIKHTYPEKSVLLHVREVTDWHGEPRGREGQEISWVSVEHLQDLDFPVANIPIIKALSLPDIYGITPDLTEYGEEFFDLLHRNLASGLRLLQYRSRHINHRDTAVILKRMHADCEKFNCRILVNGPPQHEYMDYIAGVHLTSDQLLSLSERCLGKDFLVAASCHNIVELEHAARIGIDFVVLSPVNVTGTHPDATPMGWDRFTELVADATIPVFALGGMDRFDLQRAREAGAQGIAMLGKLWNPSVSSQAAQSR